MSQARHPKPPDIADLSIEEIARRYVARFSDRKPDWNAFEDAKIEGYKRAQHRFIGAGGSGKHGDAAVIPAARLHARASCTSARAGQRRAYARGRGSILRPEGVSDSVPRGRIREANRHTARSVGMHLLPARGDTRVRQRQSRAGVLPSHAGQVAPGDDGLLGR